MPLHGQMIRRGLAPIQCQPKEAIALCGVAKYSKTIHYIYNYRLFIKDYSLLQGLQDFSTLQQILSFEIGLKCIINDYN